MRASLLPFLLLSLGAFGQRSDQYIELTVTDTVDPPMKRVVYCCSVQLDAASIYDPSLSWRQRQKIQLHAADSLCQDQEELEEQLIQAGFRVGALTNPGYKYNVVAEISKCAAGTTVEVSSLAELERLVVFVRSKGNVDGSVLTWVSDPLADTSSSQRMLMMARRRAEQLASLSGQRLGSMLRAQSIIVGEQWSSSTNYQPEYMEAAVPQYFTGYQPRAVLGNSLEPNPPMMTFRFALLADDNTTGSRP